MSEELFIMVAVGAFGVSFAGVALMLWLAPRLGLVDQPNARSLHTASTPRGGGLGVLAAIAAAWLVAGLTGTSPVYANWTMLGLAVLVPVSLLDDRYGLSAGWRFAGHLLAAALVLAAGLGLSEVALPGIALPLGPVTGGVLSLLVVGWCINLFNFMDGMDGLAGGMALIGFAALAALGLLAGQVEFALAALVVSAAGAGFLCFNYPPARIFLGDVGSVPLGFLVGAFLLWMQADGVAPLWLGLLVFAPFVLDATVTLLRRLWRRETVWQAHRSHYYQRAVLVSAPPRRVLLVSYALMVGCALSAILIRETQALTQWLVLVGWAFVFAGCAGVVEYFDSRNKS